MVILPSMGNNRPAGLQRIREAARTLGYFLVPIPHRDQTHCKRGHELAGDNLYEHGGRRHCRACRKRQQQRSKT